MKLFRSAVLLIAIILLTHPQGAICQKARSETKPGDIWLRMNHSERRQTVSGFLSGYGYAVMETCSTLEGEFALANPGILETMKRTGKSPSQICVNKAASFSKIPSRGPRKSLYDFYIGIVTKYYAKYPQKRYIPFELLILELKDGHAQSVDDLYAQGGFNYSGM